MNPQVSNIFPQIIVDFGPKATLETQITMCRSGSTVGGVRARANETKFIVTATLYHTKRNTRVPIQFR